jgi:hypothetical protein
MNILLHPNTKLVLIGLYIGWTGSVATLLANLVIVYLPVITAPPSPVLNVVCVASAFVFQEVIRKSQLKRRTKIAIFGITAILAGLAYIAFFAWALRWFSWL